MVGTSLRTQRMPSDTAVTRATDPHLLAADLIDAAHNRFFRRLVWWLRGGGVVLIVLIYFASIWLWFAIPLFIVLSAGLYWYELRRWWTWASAHDIDPQFLFGAAREAEFIVPERWVKSSGR